MPIRILLLLGAPVLLSACEGTARDAEPDGSGDGDADADADTTTGPLVVLADDRPDSPAVWLEGSIDDGHVTVQVRGEGLGPVLGVSVHVEYDGEALSEERSALASFLDPDGEAVTLVRRTTGDVALGGTRADPSQPGLDLDDPFDLATIELREIEERASRIDPVRIVVRRTDGSLVAVHSAGLAIAPEEVSP